MMWIQFTQMKLRIEKSLKLQYALSKPSRPFLKSDHNLLFLAAKRNKTSLHTEKIRWKEDTNSKRTNSISWNMMIPKVKMQINEVFRESSYFTVAKSGYIRKSWLRVSNPSYHGHIPRSRWSQQQTRVWRLTPNSWILVYEKSNCVYMISTCIYRYIMS